MQKQAKSPHRTAICTKNPCNQFLVQYLLKLRQKQANVKMLQSRGRGRGNVFDHQYNLYTKAIDSIRKYPLPILCEDQLMLLAGVGDTLAAKLVEVVRHYYRKYIKGIIDIAQDQKDTNKQQNDNKKSKVMDKQHAKTLNWMSQGSSVKSIRSAQQQLQSSQQHDSQKRDKIHPFPSALQFDKKSSKSQKPSIKTSSIQSQTYKPRSNTQAANILKCMSILQASTNSVTRKDINQCLLSNNFQKIRQWNGCRDLLAKNGYIELDPSVENEAFFLTTKGLEFVREKENEQRGNVSKKKIMEEVSLFKQKIVQKQQEQASNSMSQSFSKNPFNCSFSQSKANSQPQISNKSNPNEPFIVRKPLTAVPNQSLLLIVDTRQMKDQSQRSYFQQTLVQKYKMDIITSMLSIGDFAFCYNGEVLDFIIQRKKADDLAASVIDGRYKEQKFRLRNCGATNIVYLYEGYPSEGSPLKEKELMNALLKTRAADCFKVVKTARISQTAKYLSCIYQQLKQTIEKNPQKLVTIGSLEQYNRRNAKKRYLTIQNIFGFGLKSFPNVGKQTVGNLLRYFKSYYILFKELQKYQSNQERVEFLNGLLKGGRTQAGVTSLIVQFLFQGYQASKSDKKNKTLLEYFEEEKQKIKQKQVDQEKQGNVKQYNQNSMIVSSNSNSKSIKSMDWRQYVLKKQQSKQKQQFQG